MKCIAYYYLFVQNYWLSWNKLIFSRHLSPHHLLKLESSFVDLYLSYNNRKDPRSYHLTMGKTVQIIGFHEICHLSVATVAELCLFLQLLKGEPLLSVGIILIVSLTLYHVQYLSYFYGWFFRNTWSFN